MRSSERRVSPPSLARLGGLLYLAIIAAGIFCQLFAKGGFIVAGDPAATAGRIRASEVLWRAGIAVDLFACACTVGLACILYGLLRVVDRNLALLMVFFDAVGIGLQAAFDLNLVTTLFPLGSAAYLQAFTPQQREVLSYLAIRSHTIGFGISLLFFGLAFPIRGYLIVRSGFLPRIPGFLIAVAGVGYVGNGFALLLSPALADRLFPLVAAPILLGEVTLSLWLLLRGVDAGRWRMVAASLHDRSAP